jgi:hypothetical protein
VRGLESPFWNAPVPTSAMRTEATTAKEPPTMEPKSTTLSTDAQAILESMGDAFYALDGMWRIVYEGHRGAGAGAKWSNPGRADCSRAWSPVRMAPNRHPRRPDGMPTKGPGPFNAHSQDGGGRGLVQHALCSPAPIPAADPSRSGPCAAPASIKRCTLSYGIARAIPTHCSSGPAGRGVIRRRAACGPSAS